MSNPTKFWDRVAEKYARSPIADEAAYQHKLRLTRDYFGPDMDVLEFGCGTGSTALLHAPYVKHILATDISDGMLDIARRKAEAEKVGNVTFQRADIDELDMPDESFDAVLGLSILHLLEDKETVIAKVYRMLKPGGVFVSSTACIGDSMRWFKLVGPIGYRLGLIPLVQVFTADELERSIRNANFEIEHNWRPGPGKAVFIIARKPE